MHVKNKWDLWGSWLASWSASAQKLLFSYALQQPSTLHRWRVALLRVGLQLLLAYARLVDIADVR